MPRAQILPRQRSRRPPHPARALIHHILGPPRQRKRRQRYIPELRRYTHHYQLRNPPLHIRNRRRQPLPHKPPYQRQIKPILAKPQPYPRPSHRQRPHRHTSPHNLRRQPRIRRPRKPQRRQPKPPENQQRAQRDMQRPRNQRRLQRRYAIPRRLQRPPEQPVITQTRHSHQLRPHIPSPLLHRVIAQPDNLQQRPRKNHPQRYHQRRQRRSQRERLQQHMIGIRNPPSPHRPRDHSPHAGIQPHPRHHNRAQIRLRRAQPRDCVKPKPARPHQIRHLIHHPQHPLRHLRPPQIPQMPRNTAPSQIPRRPRRPPTPTSPPPIPIPPRRAPPPRARLIISLPSPSSSPLRPRSILSHQTPSFALPPAPRRKRPLPHAAKIPIVNHRLPAHIPSNRPQAHPCIATYELQVISYIRYLYCCNREICML